MNRADTTDSPTRGAGTARLIAAVCRQLVPIIWLLLVTLYVAVLESGALHDRAKLWLTDLAWTFASAAALLASLKAAWSQAGRIRTGWYVLSAGTASWLIGQLIWDYNELVRHVVVPVPSISDVFYWGLAILSIPALHLLRTQRAARPAETTRSGNLGLIVCSLAVAFTAAVWEPLARSSQPVTFVAAALMHAITTSAALVFSLYVLWSYHLGRLIVPVILIVLSIAMHTGAGLVYAHQLLLGSFAAGNLLNASWVTAFGLQYWAARKQATPREPRSISSRRVYAYERRIEALLPGLLLLVIAGAGVLFHQQLSTRVLAVGAGLLALFAMILGARENWMYAHERRLKAHVSRSSIKLRRARTQLRAARQNLRATQRRLQLASTVGNVGLWEWDLKSGRANYSPEWRRQLNLGDDTVGDKLDEWADRLHPEDRSRAMQSLQAFVESAEQPSHIELRLLTASGQYRWFLTQLAAARDPGGRASSILASQVEITPRKEAEIALVESESRYRSLAAELEQRVTARTAELETANQELESFAYAVSHDLKAPLRAIDGFSALLAATAKDKLNAEEQSHLARVRAGAMRMAALIDGLLTYSRMERRELTLTAVHIDHLVQQILAERELDIEQQGAEVRVNLLPLEVHADREALAIVLRNLIDNALKFSRVRRPPQIEISARRDGDCAILSVKDNGIGFEPRYHDQIFRIFQRLHVTDEYAGTGIGLALAHKAAERMQGHLWAESTPGLGTTFYLSLPMDRR